MTYRIKSWHKFQHFKDRTPPWVKLYRNILDDPDWHELDGEAAKALVMLWLIASEDPEQNGALPDIRKIAFRLRITETKSKQILTKLSKWLIQDDIGVISERYRSDAPETETETEAETESKDKSLLVPSNEAAGDLLGEIETTGIDVKNKKPPDCPHDQIIALYHKILPECPPVKTWLNGRASMLRQRWREEPKRQTLDWWERYFGYVGESDFLTGRARSSNGRPPFVADLEWLIRPNNLAKIIEGKYNRGGGA